MPKRRPVTGRPPLPRRQRRQERVAYRVTEAELRAAEAAAAAAGKTVSDYARDALNRQVALGGGPAPEPSDR